MCQCPEPLQPPNQQIKNCRTILKVLGAGLVIVMILSAVAGNIFGIFMYLLLLYMLFMSWSQFNWCFTLVFFLFCVTDFIQNTIILAGMIQYNLITSSKNIPATIYVIYAQFYFPLAIYFSHYAYRHFKAVSQQGVGGMNFIPGVNPGAGGVRAQNDEEGPRYQRVQDQRPNVNANNGGGGYFQGQGVMIG